mgnify:CR=1 FL=1
MDSKSFSFCFCGEQIDNTKLLNPMQVCVKIKNSDEYVDILELLVSHPGIQIALLCELLCKLTGWEILGIST